MDEAQPDQIGNSDNPLGELTQVIPGDTKLGLSPAHYLSTMALSLALRYVDTNTVRDGILYQQYKLEGKDIQPNNLPWVFEVAKAFEQHIMDSPNRLSDMIMANVLEGVEDLFGKDGEKADVEAELEELISEEEPPSEE